MTAIPPASPPPGFARRGQSRRRRGAVQVRDYYTNYAKRTELRAKDPKGKESLDALR